MLGKWKRWYEHTVTPWPYGEVTSYGLGYQWLRGLSPIEDWGCGPGYFRTIVAGGEKVVGIDGTESGGADVVADLTCYRSTVPAIFMRHVLEHNHSWQHVLRNALASFQRRMALVLFVPFVKETTELKVDPDIGVPTIALGELEFFEIILTSGVVVFKSDEIASGTEYGWEKVVYLLKE